VKVLHPQFQKSHDYTARFYGEALAASRLDHRNVLRVLDYGQEPDSLLYIVMELLEGDSLQQILDEGGTLPLERLVHLIAQACAGLAHAHDAGVIHRDIKPENIVVVKRRDDEGKETELVKVCDFGIAHWNVTTAKDEYGATKVNRPDTGQIVGTPVYMAPEQIRNETVDARTDVYALGIVLYELSTGHLPFLSDSPMDILTKHLLEKPKPPSQIDRNFDPGLEAIILKALAKDPAKRHRDTRELRAELRDLVDTSSEEGSGLHRRFSLRTELSSSDFLTNTADSLATLHSIDDRMRSLAYSALGDAVKTAFVSDNFATGRTLVAWIDARMADPGLRSEERVDADRARHALRDPEVVRAIVRQLGVAKADQRADLVKFLAGTGPLAAHALIEERRTRMTSLELRSQFVQTLRALGGAALPAIVAALEPLIALATRQDETLAEDLLRALPEVPSDQAGELVVRFVRFDKPSIGIAAVRAVAALWGVRARPLLVGVLDANDSAFRLLAIESLIRLGGIDDGALERLARIIVNQGNPPASEEVRLAAANAIATTMPEARPRAIWFLQQRLTPQQGFMSSLLKAIGTKEDPRVLTALARSLALIDPHGARPYLERLAAAQPDMRAALEAILAGR
jgi:serine/threonine-protein kinase